METRVLGNGELGSDLEVSATGLGCMVGCMGFSHAYGAPTGEAARRRRGGEAGPAPANGAPGRPGA